MRIKKINHTKSECRIYNIHFFQLVEGEEIRLFNAGGEVSGHIQNQDIYFHFVGVLLDSTFHG